ncbi:GNAT family N-acetyltransferase [Leptolyngbya ohadii]|uniref:GNAT family N-acetyltransferase n=1 Tax=Leptolyngbya ohadii TaxID=1962290 RepID=UPI000B59EA82|nr:GNAT family N-acetyltransferase [Leptolyngbya ohadii]
MTKATDIIVRPARSEDKTAVLAFCQHTWENHEDYIAQVWDKWIADPTGQILVVEIAGQPVAMTRVVQLAPQEGWWEGLRVDPQYRGLGLVRHLDLAVAQYCHARGITTIRCCVGSWNQGIPEMIQRRGYEPIACYQEHSAIAMPSSRSFQPLIQLAPQDFAAVWQFVGRVQSVPPLFISRGAKWQRLTIEQLQERLELGKVWGDWQQQELQGVLVQSHLESADSALWIGYLEGTFDRFAQPPTADRLPNLLQSIKHLASNLGYSTVSGFFPRTNDWLTLLQQADYQTSPGDEFWVYEKQL